MSSSYSVVQYVPDPVANERINVGVLVYSGDVLLSQFLTDWKRVKAFGGEDVGFLRDFVRGIQRDISVHADEGSDARLSGQRISQWAASWRNSIQLTDPKPSLHEPEALLREAVHLFLSEPTLSAERPRGHDKAVAITKSGIREAVKSYLGAASEKLTQQDYEVAGIQQGKHYFDVAVANGVPYLAAQAVSFEVRESRQLHNALDAIAWSITDTRQTISVPIGVVMLPPREGSGDYQSLAGLQRERAREYESFGAKVLLPESVEDWARMSLGPAFPDTVLGAQKRVRF